MATKLLASVTQGLLIGRSCKYSTEHKQEFAELLVSRVTSQSGDIVQLTLNRSAAKNAFNRSLFSSMKLALADLEADESVRAVVIASSVPGVFCAGADLKERVTFTPQQVVEFVDSLRNLFTDLSILPVPVIAAIDGVALGGGLELALAADIRVATSSSKLGLPEARLAIIPGAGGTQRLPRIINPAIAHELIYTGSVITGQQAYALGMVNHVVEADAVEKAHDIARSIAINGPLAVRAAKRAFIQGGDLPLEKALNEEKAAYATIVPTRDRIEGLNAFKERRPPLYSGK